MAVGMAEGHAWQGVCVAGDIQGRGVCMVGACMAGGMCGEGLCVVGSMHGGDMHCKGVHGKGVHGREACVAGRHAWWGGGKCDRGHTWQGVCSKGGHAWQEKWQLQQAVYIILDCILVFIAISVNRSDWHFESNRSVRK